MTQARTNPLAPGIYWIDVWKKAPLNETKPPSDINGEFEIQNWMELNPDAVKLRSKQEFAVTGQPLRYFVVFQVLAAPTPFPNILGFPTIVRLGTPEELENAAIPVSDDTVQKPPPEDAVENLKEYGESVVTTLGVLVGGYFVLKLLLNRRS